MSDVGYMMRRCLWCDCGATYWWGGDNGFCMCNGCEKNIYYREEGIEISHRVGETSVIVGVPFGCMIVGGDL